MPLFDFLCVDCGAISELLISSSDDNPRCKECGSENLKKMLSAHSSISGSNSTGLPGQGDTTCCGNSPANAGCAGPGSCCGRARM